MGYYTDFSLSVLNDRECDLTILINEINSKHKYDLIYEDGYARCVKWYDWEEDLMELSKKYPDMLIEITGDGEDSGDFWEARFKGGTEEYHDMRMPPFIALIDTSKNSCKYVSDHTTALCSCEEISNLSKAVASTVPEILYRADDIEALKKRLMETIMTYVSERAETIIL